MGNMRLEGIGEWELNGILFVNFDNAITLGESRERLEMLVYEVYQDDYADLSNDDGFEMPEMVLSPYTIFRALGKLWACEDKTMPAATKEASLKWCWENRNSKFAKEPNGRRAV